MTEENTIITQEFTIPPKRKKNTRIEINGIVFNNFLEMVEWIGKATKQIEKMKCCWNCKHRMNTVEDNEVCWNCERSCARYGEEIIKDEWEKAE